MVQHTVGSKFSEYAQPNTESGFPNGDKKMLVPVVAKKAALRDLQNENKILIPKSVVNSTFPKEGGPCFEAAKVSGTKRPPECLMSPHQQCTTSNAVNGHLVYVRRKPEAEFGKNNPFNNISSNVDYQQSGKNGVQNETVCKQPQMKDYMICIPDVAPISMASLMGYSSRKLSNPSLGSSHNVWPPTDSSYLHSPPAIPSLDHPKKMYDQHWEERFCRLQNLLEKLDLSTQDDYIQMLQSFSSVELSRHAVELEKRSIQLSLEEAKEMQRVQLLDVLGKYPRNCRASTSQRDLLEK